jgi:hypothetical protein
MKILAIENDKPGLNPDQFAPHLRAEVLGVWSLYQSGVIRELYFRQERSEAILILECTDASEAQRQLEGLPLVRAGLITFEVIPLIPYTGFARLFAA